MRKRASKILATALAAALMMTAAPVGATGYPNDNGFEGTATQTITGQVDETVVEVTLPGDVTFTVNPGLKSLNSDMSARPSVAILGEDYNIINTGRTPVKVVVKPYIVQKSGMNIATNWPAVNGSGTAYKTDLALTSGTDNKDAYIKIAAILADSLTSGSIADTDGVYRFSYAGCSSGTNSTMTVLGRNKFEYTDEGELTSGSFTTLNSGSKLNSGTYGVITLTSGAPDTVKSLKSGAQVFTLKLNPNTHEGDDGAISSDSVSSFTLVGLTNTHSNYDKYDNDNVQVGVVYDVSILSVAEETNNALLRSDAGQNAILWSGSGNGF